MRFSELSWQRKTLALVLWAAIMLAGWWLLSKLAYDWLPQRAVEAIVVAIFAFCIGWLGGERSANRRSTRDEEL